MRKTTGKRPHGARLRMARKNTILYIEKLSYRKSSYWDSISGTKDYVMVRLRRDAHQLRHNIRERLGLPLGRYGVGSGGQSELVECAESLIDNCGIKRLLALLNSVKEPGCVRYKKKRHLQGKALENYKLMKRFYG